MFAIRDRVRPCSARSSPRSVGRLTVSVPSSCATSIRCGMSRASSPSGPLTITRAGLIETETPAGSSIGDLPILLMVFLLVKSRDFSPHKTDDFAADPALLRGPAGHHAVRGGQDRGPHAAEHARHPVLARVDAPAGLGDPLQVRDHTLSATAVLELDHERVERVAVTALGP